MFTHGVCLYFGANAPANCSDQQPEHDDMIGCATEREDEITTLHRPFLMCPVITDRCRRKTSIQE